MLLTLCSALAAQDKPPLKGRVVDEQSRPLANVAVCTFANGERWTSTELAQSTAVHTDPTGRFELAVATATRSPEWDSVLFVAPGRLSMVVRRQHIEFAPIVLPAGAVLAGRVVDGSGNPIAGARVEASDYLREVVYLRAERSDRIEPAPVAATRTDARGTFVLPGACGSAAWLVADADGFRETGIGPVSTHDPLAIVLEKAPMLRGRVVDPENGAIGDLLVQNGM